MSTKEHLLRAFKMAGILILLVCSSAMIAPSLAHAQGSYQAESYASPGDPPPVPPSPAGFSRFEPKYVFSLFLGSRFGGNIALNTPNVDYLPISNSWNYGFNAGARFAPHFFGEFMWNRQTTTLSAHDISTNQTVPLTNNAHLDMFQGSLLYEIWASGKVRPFVVGGIGFTHFDSHGILSFSDRFSYNLGGGVKYLFAPHLALRAEMRWSPSRTTSSSTTFCDQSLGCFVTPISNHAEQGQANVGLEFRF
ncbi:MAG TPA: porin family protein [Candidatus Acidoferrales bacterium]|nr:porin family protein [Candidatus Acidoferrales bacterium]